MEHERFSECIFCIEIEGHPCPDSTYMVPESLYQEINELNKFSPALISVTYGAGGSNKEHSLEIVKQLSAKKFNTMPHFTCVCSNKEQINQYLDELNKLSIENILALKMKNLNNEVKINELNLLLDAHKSLIDRIKILVNIEDK